MPMTAASCESMSWNSRPCSLMVPCPGSAHALQLLAARPHLRFGVHLTLVCDLPSAAWGPVTTRAAVPSLLSPSGTFLPPSGIPQLLARARIEEVEREFRAQLEVVLRAGLSPTHLDWHCLADGGREDVFEVTRALAREHGLATRVWLPSARTRLRGEGLPVVDHNFLDSFDVDLHDKVLTYMRMLRDLPPGLSEWAVHPAWTPRRPAAWTAAGACAAAITPSSLLLSPARSSARKASASSTTATCKLRRGPRRIRQ